MTTKVREISFQRPFPSAARPCKKARCSTAVQGDPSEGFVVGVVVDVAASTTAAPAAVCIGAAAGRCAASRAGVIQLGGV